ncbi:meteorin-like protein [Argiope bruennichi]|nr:meteorin-like protein [Argiope bruennichi]
MELYCVQGRRHRPFVILVFFFFVVCLVSTAPISDLTRRISDECDWFGSGLEDTSSPTIGVQSVYLRCREGKIRWEYPRGALRVVLRIGHFHKDFQGCLKVSANSSGASLYLEGHKKLHLLYRNNNSVNSQQCFRSIGGHVALFLEAHAPSELLKKDLFELMYDLEPIQPKSFSECRPCTDRELIYAFCTSDFVARGSIFSLHQNEHFQRTELTITASEIIRDSVPRVFSEGLSPLNKKIAWKGVVHRPQHCGTKTGSGEFIFFGRWRLGDPILRCAPRWTEWKKVRRKATFSENVDCVLE